MGCFYHQRQTSTLPHRWYLSRRGNRAEPTVQSKLNRALNRVHREKWRGAECYQVSVSTAGEQDLGLITQSPLSYLITRTFFGDCGNDCVAVVWGALPPRCRKQEPLVVIISPRHAHTDSTRDNQCSMFGAWHFDTTRPR